ncbi:MAG: winged helix DNA-binding domain-containing protein [Chloroflexi bacterium]|nr:winged helix DNA-binding domain-containing protein [Chloroflexota bacterium]MCH8339719.1 winged helix DNA-binding domain-containing protein [Chloroflexota bacterium]
MPSQSKTNNRISIKAIEAYRAKTYKRNGPLTTVDQAIKFVRERGFIFFWPIKDVELPSLWMAVAGDRPVAPEHDDPGHVTWGWKDQMLGERKWYYAKLLRKKATLVSLEVAPYFYALTENYGDPDEDYLIQYEAGRLKHENKRIYEALLGEGPMDAVALRRKVGLTGKGNKYRFDRAVVELQTDMKILPIGVAEAGVWNYAFIYDIVPRHFPDLSEQARPITESQARLKLTELYFRSVGAASTRELGKLFGWRKVKLTKAVQLAEQAGLVHSGLTDTTSGEDLIALTELR